MSDNIKEKHCCLSSESLHNVRNHVEITCGHSACIECILRLNLHDVVSCRFCNRPYTNVKQLKLIAKSAELKQEFDGLSSQLDGINCVSFKIKIFV